MSVRPPAGASLQRLMRIAGTGEHRGPGPRVAVVWEWGVPAHSAGWMKRHPWRRPPMSPAPADRLRPVPFDRRPSPREGASRSLPVRTRADGGALPIRIRGVLDPTATACGMPRRLRRPLASCAHAHDDEVGGAGMLDDGVFRVRGGFHDHFVRSRGLVAHHSVDLALESAAFLLRCRGKHRGEIRDGSSLRARQAGEQANPRAAVPSMPSEGHQDPLDLIHAPARRGARDHDVAADPGDPPLQRGFDERIGEIGKAQQHGLATVFLRDPRDLGPTGRGRW